MYPKVVAKLPRQILECCLDGSTVTSVRLLDNDLRMLLGWLCWQDSRESTVKNTFWSETQKLDITSLLRLLLGARSY